MALFPTPLEADLQMIWGQSTFWLGSGLVMAFEPIVSPGLVFTPHPVTLGAEREAALAVAWEASSLSLLGGLSG